MTALRLHLALLAYLIFVLIVTAVRFRLLETQGGLEKMRPVDIRQSAY